MGIRRIISFFLLMLIATIPIKAERQTERIDHGLSVAVADGGVMLSWRYLESDGENCRFTLYRDGKRIARISKDAATCFVDNEGNTDSHYQLGIKKHFLGKRIIEESFIVFNESVRDNTTHLLCPYKTITLRTPEPVMCRGYYTNAYVVAYDFDGANLHERWICKAESKHAGRTV